MKKIILFSIFLSFVAALSGQTTTTQTVKGIVVDKDSQLPLIGANVYVSSVEPMMGTATDINGVFRIENVPTGRHDLKCDYTGYQPFFLEGVIVNSAKEYEVNIGLVEEAFEMGTVEVIAGEKNTKKALNEYNALSSRSFSVEEAQKYPGSIADPSRMALGFAGVQMGQDNNNDLIVRSNASIGVLWRLEGVDIINPNHFARRGGTGGGISAFSGSVLSNSDFATGAFAPEYGNAIAGVFDMKFRKGNRDKREYTVRAGLLGLDFATEGPIKKGRSSYLINYRYSTLGILNAFGLHVVDARTTNNFQDVSFNFYFPTKDNKTIVNLWGIGGLSKEVKSPESDVEWYLYEHQTRYDFTSNMGTVGLSASRILKNDDYLKTVLSVSANYITWDRDSVDVDLNRGLIENEKYLNGRYDLTTFYKRKFSPKFAFKTGLTLRNRFYTLERGYHQFTTNNYANDLDEKGNTFQLQYYLQGIYRLTDRLTFTGGLHNLFFALNNSFSSEPRLNFKYKLSELSSLSLGYGLHSQPLPIGTYFISNSDAQGNELYDNQDLKLLKAQHVVLGYDQSFKNKMHLNVELYYQHLYNVPIIPGGSRFWMLNELQSYGKQYDNQKLASEGKGRNIGVDVTFEKYLSRNLFFLVTGSVYQSTYTIDNVGTYSTRYDGRYSSSIMVGKEFTLKKNNAITFSFRNFFNGGLRYTPGDAAASLALGDLVEDESRAFEEQMKDYWRIDLQMAYRKDKPTYAWSLILDTQNIVNYDNQRELNYDYKLNDFVFKQQSGFVPVLSFQLDF